MISRALPSSHRRQAATAQPHPVGRPVATGGGTVLTSMSQPRVQRCVHDPVPGSSRDRCLSRPGAVNPQNVRAADGSGSKGFGGRRRAPRFCSVNPRTIPVRGAPVPQSRALHTPASTAANSGGFGCVPGLSPGDALDGDGARTWPPRPHRGDASGSARGERRSKRRAAATPGPRRSRTGPSATHSHTQTV
jgi:hypothetical protein